MYSKSSFATLAAIAAFAIPSSRADIGDPGVHCGTTSDATFSDCQTLMNDDVWNANVNTGNLCHYTDWSVIQIDWPAYNVACYQNCCVYYATGTNVEGFDIDTGTIKAQAQSLFGCADSAVNKINGLITFADKHGVCISDRNGCGDCFDDLDFPVDTTPNSKRSYSREIPV